MNRPMSALDQTIEEIIRNTSEAIGLTYTDPAFFTLPDNDERMSSELQEFADACRLADMYQTHVDYALAFQEFVDKTNSTVLGYRLRMAWKKAWRWISPRELLNSSVRWEGALVLFKKMFLPVLFWSFPILITIMFPANQRWISPNIRTNILSLYLIFFLVLLAIAMLKVDREDLQTYKELRSERIAYGGQLQPIADINASQIEKLEMILKHYDDKNGLAEAYWPYSKRLWELIRSERADTRNEALALIDREIFRNELEHQVKG